MTHTHDTTTIADYDWTYDAFSRVTSFTSPDGTSDYTYDETGQLTAADHDYQTDESYCAGVTIIRCGFCFERKNRAGFNWNENL